MINIISEFWYGNINPSECYKTVRPRMKRLEDVIVCDFKKLEEILNGIEKQMFEKYNDYMYKYAISSNEQVFCDGFCLGARMTTEAFIGAEKLVQPSQRAIVLIFSRQIAQKKRRSSQRAALCQSFLLWERDTCLLAHIYVHFRFVCRFFFKLSSFSL